jgi:site-specific recombinase XerD
MLLLDTGARRDDMAGLKLADVDLELDVLLVLGKGRRERGSWPFRTVVDRYRSRSRVVGVGRISGGIPLLHGSGSPEHPPR